MKNFVLPILILAAISLHAQQPARENHDPGTEKEDKSPVVPQQVNFQGRLHDNDGNPVEGSRTVVFSLYATPAGGTALWTETRTVQFVDGLFGVSLGEVTPLDAPVFSSAERWLGIKIGTDAEMTPRTRIASVGYAMQTHESDPTWDGDANTTGSISRMGAVGIGTETPAAPLHVRGDGEGEGNVLFEGVLDYDNPGDPPATGEGTRMMWYPDKAAFRVGHLSSHGASNWDKDSIGNASFAAGNNSKAKANNSIAMGHTATASGIAGVAMGYFTEASGSVSTAIGSQTTASGSSSTAMGSSTTASGVNSTAIGNNTEASGSASIAMGFQTTASGINSTAMGSLTQASGHNSVAMGQQTLASGSGSTAMGRLTTASGLQSTAMGLQTTASGPYSTAMGYGTIASGSRSTAMGLETTASEFSSIAMGYRTTASGNTSTAIGSHTIAPSSFETALGRYNTSYTPANTMGWNSNDRLFVIGNGPSEENRSDAFMILKNGNTGIGGPAATGLELNLHCANNNRRLEFTSNTIDPILQPDLDAYAFLGQPDRKWWRAYVFAYHGVLTSIQSISDKSYKRNIQPMDSSMDKLMLLNPLYYDLIPEKLSPDSESRARFKDNDLVNQMGFLAQDVQKIFPQLVKPLDDDSDVLTLGYSGLIPVMVKGMQEQQEMINQQEQTIRVQEQTIHQQKQSIENQQQIIESLLRRVEALEAR